MPAAKRCTGCGERKPLRAFNRLRKANDGRQPVCRECHKEYHRDNWDRHMAQIGGHTKRRREIVRRFIVDYLLDHPCVDCGETDIVVLDFDHVGEVKNHNVGYLIGSGTLAKVRTEIELCEVVCANCHRRRTASRAPTWYRIDMLGDIAADD